MNYTLMHKDIPVADLTLDETTGSIQRIDALFRGGHLPVGVSVRRGMADRAALNAVVGRTAPSLPVRSGCVDALAANWESPSPQQLLLTRNAAA